MVGCRTVRRVRWSSAVNKLLKYLENYLLNIFLHTLDNYWTLWHPPNAVSQVKLTQLWQRFSFNILLKAFKLFWTMYHFKHFSWGVRVVHMFIGVNLTIMKYAVASQLLKSVSLLDEAMFNWVYFLFYFYSIFPLQYRLVDR